MRARSMLVILVTVAIAIGSSACQGPHAGGLAETGVSAFGSPTGVGPAACEITQAGANVRVQITSADSAFCADMARSLSSGGEFWTVGGQSGHASGLQLVCAMSSASRSAAVLDTGSAVIGRSVCSGLLQAGWQEDTQKEAQLAAAAASASAEANAARQSAQLQDEAAKKHAREVQEADAALQGVKGWPAKLATDSAQIDDALKKVNAALAQTRKLAAKGEGDSCDNVSDVAYEASQSVGYEATQGVGYIASQEVGYDVENARSDLDRLDKALSALAANAGSQPPAGAEAARSALITAIVKAIGHANEVIDKANAAAVTAYAIANDLSGGSCSGYGPGSYEPAAHIR